MVPTLAHPDKKPRLSRADVIALIASCAFFMEILDATIIVPAIPQMAESFRASSVALSTGISSYLITVAIFIPASAWLCERFGTRLVFGVAIGVFTLASMLCGLSENLTEFTLARILQGVGGAMMSPVGRLEVLRRTDKAQLLRAIALLTWPGLTAFAVGPPLGGFITSYASWPWIFFINVPIGIVGIVLVVLFFEKSAPVVPRRFDPLGFFLIGGSLALVMYGLELVSRSGNLSVALACLGAGGVLGAFAVRHTRHHSAPLLSLTPFRMKTFVIGVIEAGALFRIQVGMLSFVLPVMCQIGLGYDPLGAGLLTFVFLFGDLTAKIYANRVLRRFGFKRTLIAFSALVGVSALGLAAVGPATPLWIFVLVLYIAGSTRSVIFSGLNSLSFADIPQAQMHVASTLTSMFQQVFTALGVSVAAIALSLSLLMRGQDAAALSLADFRVAVILTAVLAFASIASYIRLSRRDGTHVTGHLSD